MTVVVAHSCQGFLRSDAFDLHSIGGVFEFVLSFLMPGAAAVILFFVLSGFVLTQGTEDKSFADVARDYPRYAIRRVFRIMPAMSASAVAAFVVYHYSWYDPSHLRLLAMTLLMQDSSINGPLWSLPIEMFWSLLLPPLFYLSARVGVIGNLALLVGAYRLIYHNDGIDLLRYGICFQAGMLIGAWGGAITTHLPRKMMLVALGAALIVYCSTHTLCRLFFPARNDMFIIVLTVASFPIVAYCAHVRTGSVGALLRLPAIRFVGRVSYSLYVFHFLVLALVNMRIGAIMSQEWGEAHTLICHLIALATVPALSLIVAYASYRCIEVPLMNMGNRLAFRLFPFKADMKAAVGLAPAE
jgi:peptidoglycan/LPS O-acetylase OafA/YrhL